MDMGLFRDEERFPTFDSLDDYTSTSGSIDGMHNAQNSDFWELDTEIEINGDLALIPMSSNLLESLNNKSTSPNIKELLMNDWHQYMSIENDHEEFILDGTISIENGDILEPNTVSIFDEAVPTNFDIAEYINDNSPQKAVKDKNFDTKPIIAQKKPGAGVKKIDFKAQRYIVEEDEDSDSDSSQSEDDESEDEDDQNEVKTKISDSEDKQNEVKNLPKPEINDPEDDVDVETVSDGEESAPVLEAVDLKSLLEQFEATQIPEQNKSKSNTDDTGQVMLQKGYCEISAIENFMQKPEPVENETTKEPEVIVQNKPKTKNIETTIKEEKSHIKKDQGTAPLNNIKKTTSTSAETTQNNSAILDQLPKELIARIKESGKRKPISVIPPMPSRKRGRAQTAEGIQKNIVPEKPPDAIKLDHDYCSVQTGYFKNPKKDSGFESSEEDDRVNIKHQPVVKNDDGKLMVSLLKVNTIHETKKRKLNLEDYKKRRGGVLRKTTSQGGSPQSSACSSPIPEDEHMRILKHQEKLQRMAKEVLNAAPKSETSSNNNNNVTPENKNKIILLPNPPDMVKKTVVSIGVNTDFVTIDKDFKKDALAPVQQLEEIKPLLEKVSGQINRNSLITSVIENIPKIITNNKAATSSNTVNKTLEHGEDKTILYLPKEGNKVKTISIGIQTNISLLAQNKQRRYRRRNSSTSSSSSECSVDYKETHRSRKRKISTSSSYSNSSRSSSASSSYSSRGYSRSRSRSRSRSVSRSPVQKSKRKIRKIDEEHLKEVEERRVIYVGRISSTTVKEDLRKRFGGFGPITNVSLHFRDQGYRKNEHSNGLDNYGFVTFANKYDAYEALEHGNDEPFFPKYDISFGGRRLFCQSAYSDLDNVRDESYPQQSNRGADNSFDMLLKEAQEKLRKRKA